MFNWLIYLLTVDYGELRTAAGPVFREIFQWKHLPAHLLFFSSMLIFIIVAYELLLPHWILIFRSIFDSSYVIPNDDSDVWDAEFGGFREECTGVCISIGNNTYFKNVNEIPES